ncbi:hypothetical protein KEM56_006300 [Ascosphaera pollenicola]|nr:hypothetical protein KEM56_006300 [Ascosphaera pollenicola]
MKDPSHPAHSLTANEITKLRLKSKADGPDPGSKLKITDVKQYKPWEFSWHHYLTDADKINYALTWLEGDLYDTMDAWWSASSDDKSYATFLFEIQTLLGVQFLHADARRDLEYAFMTSDEKVRAYYSRLRPLWEHAGSSERDRIDKLFESVPNHITNPLLGRKFDSVRDLLIALLDIERDLNARQMAKQRSHPTLSSKPQNTFKPRRGGANADNDIPSATDKASNSKFPPTSSEPNEWAGRW